MNSIPIVDGLCHTGTSPILLLPPGGDVEFIRKATYVDCRGDRVRYMDGEGLHFWRLDRSILDLDDVTGQDHAARYIAKAICHRVGWPEPLSVLIRWAPRGLVLLLSFPVDMGLRQVAFADDKSYVPKSVYSADIPTHWVPAGSGIHHTATPAEALHAAFFAVAPDPLPKSIK